MSIKKTILAMTAVALPLMTGTTQAQVSVRQLDADSLRVTEYRGKPPHRRLTISEDRDPAAYTRYQAMLDHDPQPGTAVSSRAGAPGKSLPRQRARVSGDAAETTESSPSRSLRNWRGAPGKSIPRIPE